MIQYTILLYNNSWNAADEKFTELITDGFMLTNDHAYLNEAIAVIFHMPTILPDEKLFRKGAKRDGQLWVFWSMECEAHYKWQYDPEILSLFDVMATYKLSSDIPVPYFQSNYPELLKREPAPKHSFVNAFISSEFNQSKRLECLKELMQYIDVCSYGKIFNNKVIADDDGQTTKEIMISSYKFTIAFENAIAEDYVTEKFFQPLIAGSVPVYLGAPNIEDFSPGDHCYINVNSFPSVKALADYLLLLNEDDGQYERYLQWKKQPLRESFASKADLLGKNLLIKLCDLIKKRMENDPSNKEKGYEWVHSQDNTLHI